MTLVFVQYLDALCYYCVQFDVCGIYQKCIYPLQLKFILFNQAFLIDTVGISLKYIEVYRSVSAAEIEAEPSPRVL